MQNNKIKLHTKNIAIARFKGEWEHFKENIERLTPQELGELNAIANEILAYSKCEQSKLNQEVVAS